MKLNRNGWETDEDADVQTEDETEDEEPAEEEPDPEGAGASIEDDTLSSSGRERLRKQVEKKYMKNARDINSNDSEEDEEDDEDMDEEEISNDSGFASIRGEYETGDPFFIINRP